MARVSISRKVFNKKFFDILSCEKRYQILFGGAGSGKSVFQAQRFIYKAMKLPNWNALVLRKVGEANKDSTFALLRQVINQWGVDSLFKVRSSPMRITCRNGNEIIFKGMHTAEDREKVKSITFARGILNEAWMEELSEFVDDDLGQIDLRLRGKSKHPFILTGTLNPISVNHWVKRMFIDCGESADILVHKSTYLDNRFIDDAYRQKMQRLKEIDEYYYQVYALGNWGIVGNRIYTNWQQYEDRKPVEWFDDLAYGIDFGYNNPSAIIQVGLKDNDVYIRREFYRSGLTNTKLIREAQKFVGKSEMDLEWTADSAEPDRIEEFADAGFDVRPCTKGAGSVSYGIDWLKQRRVFVHSSCVNTWKEHEAYKWKKDRDGNEKDEPVPVNDHAMDAVRYATEPFRNMIECGAVGLEV